jgi:hypothetical protein
MRRTNKHQSQRQREAASDGAEPVITIKGARVLCNALLDDHTSGATLDRAMRTLQGIHDRLGQGKTLIVACAHCAARVGLKRCARCPRESTLRYCSRECQLAAWPSHKPTCGNVPVCVD